VTRPRRAAAKCSSQNALCRPSPTAITFTGSAKTFSDHAATDYGIDDHEQLEEGFQLQLSQTPVSGMTWWQVGHSRPTFASL
jgi:hypothetical protein